MSELKKWAKAVGVMLLCAIAMALLCAIVIKYFILLKVLTVITVVFVLWLIAYVIKTDYFK